MKLTKRIHFIVLAVFLILHGLALLIGLSFAGMHIVMGGLALAAGVCMLLEV